jgi:hypothetical protein
MPLDIDLKPLFNTTVTFRVPSGDDVLEQSCRVTFEAIDNSEQDTFDLATPEGTKGFLVRVIRSIGDVVDHNREPVPYTEELRDRLLDKPWSRSRLVAAYARGLTVAAEGN